MKYIFVFCIVISVTVCQKDDNLKTIVNSIFPVPDDYNNSSTRNPLESTTVFSLQPRAGENSCECVPFYLCNNDTINTNGYNILDIRFQGGTCQDYLTVCCPIENTVDKPILPTRIDTNNEGCGMRNPDGIGFRIKENIGKQAEFGEFPWMAAILRKDISEGEELLVYQCGGSLIHPKVVLTAAHCVISTEKKFKVRIGEWDTQTRNEMYPHQERDVVTVITHPQYYSGALFNDIALLILDSFVLIAPNVDTICLPPQADDVGPGNCFASGWGKDVWGKQAVYQVIMKKVELPIVDRDVCQENLRKTRLGRHFRLHKSFICAGGDADQDTCTGDGGSPLVCSVPGRPEKFYQAGIVSWGISCGLQDVPGVYTNVAMYINWINQQLSNYSVDQSYYTF